MYKNHVECLIITFMGVYSTDAVHTHPGPVLFTGIVRTAAFTLGG